MFLRFLCSVFILMCCSSAFSADTRPIYIGLDAEFGHKTSTSAQAVQKGIEIAIEEINSAGGVLNGRKLALLTKDNRSISAIGVDNFRAFSKNPEVVAVFGGKFSPIYVECIPLAHEYKMILMNPWGSADSITDHSFRPSYTFRLSLKDAWAAPALLQFAKKRHQAQKVGIMLPNTAWGRSNQTALEKAAPTAGVQIVGQRWYNWGDRSLLSQYQELRAQGAQALILVANENEGAILVREIGSLPVAQRLPIVSHWGVTGGDFARMTGNSLHDVDFSVIQTFSFLNAKTPTAKRVLAALKSRYQINRPEDIKSPVGIAQAYDLTHLLAKAIKKAGTAERSAVREALERLGSHDGLVRKYHQPFTPMRHDALSSESIFFARYTAEDVLMPVDRKGLQ